MCDDVCAGSYFPYCTSNDGLCRRATVPTRLCWARSNEKGEKGVS